MKRSVAASLASAVCLVSATAAIGQGLDGYFERARTACAPHVDAAFSALQGVCTAAAVLDLAATPDNPSCAAARGVAVAYVKACMEHAAALLRDGEPTSALPPPKPGLGTIGPDGAAPPPAPPGWPDPAMILPLEAMDAMIAAIRFGAVIDAMAIAVHRPRTEEQPAPEDAVTVSPSEAASAPASPEADAAVGPTDTTRTD